jgi:hypothetical protein
MNVHKFGIGQLLAFTPNRMEDAPLDGFFEVVRLMPHEGRDFWYRVRHAKTGQERMVSEAQLQKP